ncbi:MAG: hypothetical protein KFF68_05235 [Desulfosarcina sp.]|nr:hypothetical protein [Desulfosarcina sp.]
MDSALLLGGKFTFRVGGKKQVFVKKPVEHLHHVVMKALLWALVLPVYDQVQVEVAIGHRYKPDLVTLGFDAPLFWAEAGRVGSQKLKRLIHRFPRTHFAFAVWGSSLASIADRVQGQALGVHRPAPIDVIAFPEDAAMHFIDSRGTIRVHHKNLTWQHFV